MKAIEAVAVVLKDANGPLHYREITKRMLARELWTTARQDAVGHSERSDRPLISRMWRKPRASFVPVQDATH